VRSGNRAFRFAGALVHEVADDDLPGMAAEMAYRFLFAFIPLLLLLATTLGFIGEAIGLPGLFARLIEAARPVVPAAVIEILEGVAARLLVDRSGSFFTLGLIGTLWGAASGVGALMKGLNRAYDVERARSLWRRQLWGFAVALALPFIALAALAFASLGRRALAAAATTLGLGEIGAAIVGTASVVALASVFFAALSVVYHRLPNVRIPYRYTIPGTVVAMVGLVGLSVGFGIYLDVAGGSAAAYTTFGTAFVFLLWLYLASLVVLVGAEVNALLAPAGRSRWSSA